METNMSEADIKEIICALFLGGDTDYPIDAETDLLEEGICDSLGLVQIVGELKNRQSGLKVLDPDITAENFGSIARILGFLAAHA
jgi:acyl carrier protein